jgi:hypothetical protein
MTQALLAFNNATIGKAATWDQPYQPTVAELLTYNKGLLQKTTLANFTWGIYAKPNLTSQCSDYVQNASQTAAAYGPYVSWYGWVLLQVGQHKDIC